MNDYQILKLENRIAKMESSVKNIKCPGVLRSLQRELRNLQKKNAN